MAPMTCIVILILEPPKDSPQFMRVLVIRALLLIGVKLAAPGRSAGRAAQCAPDL